MSFNKILAEIVFEADTIAIDAAIGRIETQVKTVDKKIKSQFNELRYTWSYINHLLTISFGLAQRLGKGTALAAGAQTAATIIQTAQTQFAVAHIGKMAFTALLEKDFVNAALLFTLAAAMEAQMGAIFILEAEAKRNEAYAETIAAQMEAYSI